MKHLQYKLAAAITVSAFLGTGSEAMAGTTTSVGFGGISANIRESVSDIPRLLTVMSYLVGVGFAIAGVLKLKAHVDNPQTPLKDGVMRLGAGGALLALPVLIEAMQGSIGTGGSTGSTVVQQLDALDF